ncbi:hypothetical protein BU202_04955 [Streptococcus cuniculi]|uniref:Gram-positive cocci surface proteins LPxTG domain-containing protein n=2 Tax=Streptococcus cuniculi TaxID=1432788 RepID=A0A1Q8E7Q6_9STRE|nr:hypothetical protein BU202_04955 [Streptococcus cuniculi]
MLLAMLLAVLGIGSSPLTAQAEELTNAITDISIWDVGGVEMPKDAAGTTKLVKNANYRFEVGFDLSQYDGKLGDGDTFTFTIPEPITAPNGSFDLVDKELGLAFATATTVSNGTGKGATVTVALKNSEEYFQKKGGSQVQGVKGKFYIPFNVPELLDRHVVDYREDETQGKLSHTISVIEPPVRDFTYLIGNENFTKAGGGISYAPWQSAILDKSGEHRHPWAVRVNTNQSTYESISINDSIPADSSPMQYIPETLEILAGYYDSRTLQIADSPQKLEVGKDYTVEYNSSYTSMIINILNPSTRMAKNGKPAAYRIMYSTTSPEDGTTVVNEASMTGDNQPVAVGRKENSEKLVARVDRPSKVTTGGSIELEVGYRISLYKVDSETNNRLSGATFAITTPTGRTESVTTNEQGVAQSKVYSEDEIKAGTFTIVETKAPLGYVLDNTPIEVKVTASGIVRTIKNTREKLSIPVRKVWEDANNQDGKRPESVTIQLLANGEEVDDKTLTLSAENDWQADFENLNKYDDQGQAIAYTIREVGSLNGYQSRITGNKTDGFTVTNSYSPEMIDVTVQKKWEDSDNQDGKRPNEITVHLLANGEQVDSHTIQAATDGNWTTTFTNKPKYANGQVIRYTVEEVAVKDYTTKIDDFTIVNSYTPKEISYQVTKKWADSGNQDGKRPSSITVQLYKSVAGSEPVAITGKTLTLTAADQTDTDIWVGSFTDLPQFEKGQEISYSVREDDATLAMLAEIGYVAKVDGQVITNSHTPEMIRLTGTKVWDDGNNQDGKRPTNIVVVVKDGQGTEVDRITVTPDEKGQWSFTSKELPKYANGKAISYSVEEIVTAEYSASITADGTHYTITNSYTPQKTSIKGSKVWNDGNNQDGIRPTSITVHLFANGVDTGKTATASEATGWHYSFDDVDQYKDGQLIQYTVTEDAVPGYTTQIDGTLITNSHVPKEDPKKPGEPKEPKDSKDPKTPKEPKADTPSSQAPLPAMTKKVLPKTNSTTSLGLIVVGMTLLAGISFYLMKKKGK